MDPALVSLSITFFGSEFLSFFVPTVLLVMSGSP